MRTRHSILLAVLLLGAAGAAPAATLAGLDSVARPALGTAPPAPLALAQPADLVLPPGDRGAAVFATAAEPVKVRERAPGQKLATALSGERARILLRSLTIPGWGQATLGRRGAAKFFGLTEAAIWTAFTAFRVQSAIRTDDYLRQARTFAGIDLAGRDEEWRRIVGSFSSSEEYNRLVVARDAANLFLSDPLHPDYEGYRAYIASHSLTGGDSWTWANAADQERYRGERKYAQRAEQRANTALAVAVINRVVSALHAARVAGHEAAPRHSWRLEMVPGAGTDPTALQLRVRADF